MLKFSDFITLNEGVHDPAKLKAIFLAGGPGSGKSYVQDRVKGDLGFKVVNSDTHFERGMKQHGIDPKMPEHEKNKRDEIRAHAKETSEKQMKHYKNGRLGMIIDGTGKDFHKIKAHSEHLRSLGYDTHMVFVNTSLDTAKARNRGRPRSLPDHEVEHYWNKVQNNIGKFQNHFGDDKFKVVDNNHANEDILNKVHKHVRKIATKPVENHIGQEWIQQEKDKIAGRNGNI